MAHEQQWPSLAAQARPSPNPQFDSCEEISQTPQSKSRPQGQGEARLHTRSPRTGPSGLAYPYARICIRLIRSEFTCLTSCKGSVGQWLKRHETASTEAAMLSDSQAYPERAAPGCDVHPQPPLTHICFDSTGSSV